MYLDSCLGKFYRWRKESAGSIGSFFYLGWGTGCREVGRIAVVAVGSSAVWRKERFVGERGGSVRFRKEIRWFFRRFLINYFFLELSYDY